MRLARDLLVRYSHTRNPGDLDPASVPMAWCEQCLLDHTGPCLDERRRRDFAQALAQRSRACPYCGVDGPVCPVAPLGRRTVPVCRTVSPTCQPSQASVR